ncbi:MAG: NAD(P)H-dependent glycerol-3-phosphate dehydrogenase [Alphaproteobacteria bacterium]
MIERVCIIGAGAWGTALAIVLRRAGRDVIMRARDAQVAAAIGERHENPLYLPDVHLDPAIEATTGLRRVAEADAVLLVTPAQAVRETMGELAPHLAPSTPLVICAKGIELGTGRLMGEVIEELRPGQVVAALSGPTFAGEVARGLPTAVTVSCADPELGAALVDAFGTAAFRPYYSADCIGTQIGGAVKNVVAIACGIVEGRGLGENARAALMTRGLAEITRFGMALGAERRTLMGLSGLGDLVLTCSSRKSRNYDLGVEIGGGRTLEELMASRRTVAEGVATAPAVLERARDLGVDLPICRAVAAILHEGADIATTIKKLLARRFRREDIVNH